MTEVQTFGEGELVGLYRSLGVTQHPMLALPGLEQVRVALETEAGKAGLMEFLQKRQQRIQLAIDNPLEWGFEAETWVDSDHLLEGTWAPKKGREERRDASPTLTETEEVACNVLAIFGGNRAQKSFYALKRLCQLAHWYPGCLLAAGAETEKTSIATVQKYVYSFLKPFYKHLMGKKDAVHKFNYSQAGGFTDRTMVLPNGSEMHFVTYGEDPGKYEGVEFGCPVVTYDVVTAKRREQGLAVPPNIGAVMDESMPLSWARMLVRRARYRKAKVLWPFTPVKGITPAIKEVVGNSAVTLESRRSELLPRRNIADVPEGHMPYVRRCAWPNAYAIYFFTEFNKWGPEPGRTYYDEVKGLCAGKESQYTERVAYGYARDAVARAFPKFGSWNVVKRSQLPAVGTNYFLCDPAGARNWFMMWVRVCPLGDREVFYIYRDWPDARTYGEWAIPTEREVDDVQMRGWDGDAGPAQNGLGLGAKKLVEMITSLETVKGTAGERRDASPTLLKGNVDPYHVRLLERARQTGQEPGTVREEIAERLVDPRAGRSEHLAEQGGTCIIEQFAEEGMDLAPASGVQEEEGLQLVNELLDWNMEEDLCPVTNQPHLFVSEDCEQVRWMFENYTGRGGAKGACKDPADLARYMALGNLKHVESWAKGREGRGF